METYSDMYQVIVTNIHWSGRSIGNYIRKNTKASLPMHMSLDIPNNVLEEAKKSKNAFNDIIETFCYNILAKKFGYEVNRCQIWLPLEG